jgi:hypothetical protein
MSTEITLWNGRTVPRVGMGCWAIGGPLFAGDVPLSYGEVDDNASRAGIAAALDSASGFSTPRQITAPATPRRFWAKRSTAVTM